MQRKNRGEGTSLPMGELVKDPAALARLAQSGEARQLVSLLKQSGGVQERRIRRAGRGRSTTLRPPTRYSRELPA